MILDFFNDSLTVVVVVGRLMRAVVTLETVYSRGKCIVKPKEEVLQFEGPLPMKICSFSPFKFFIVAFLSVLNT